MIRNLHRFIKNAVPDPPPVAVVVAVPVEGTTCLYTYVATKLSQALKNKKGTASIYSLQWAKTCDIALFGHCG